MKSPEIYFFESVKFCSGDGIEMSGYLAVIGDSTVAVEVSLDTDSFE